MFFKSLSEKISIWEAARKTDKLVGLLTHRDAPIRCQAIAALGRMGNASAVQTLLPLRQDPACKDAVAQALESIAVGIFQSLQEMEGALQPYLFQPYEDDFRALLFTIGHPAARAAEQALYNPSAAVRSAAIAVTARFKVVKSLRILISRLSDIEPEVRDAAMAALREFGQPTVQPVVEEMILKGNVVFNPQAAVLLQSFLKTPDDPKTAARLSASLREFEQTKKQGEDGASSLITRLTEKDPEARRAIIQSLVDMGKAAMPAIQAALRDKNPDLRVGALRVLAVMPGAQQVVWFFKKLSDADPEVRNAAQQGLREKLDVAQGPFEQALEAMSTDATPMLVKAFIDMGWQPTNDRQKVSAAWILQDWAALEKAGSGAVPMLVGILQDTSDKEEGRLMHLMDVLGALKDAGAVPALVEQLRQGSYAVRCKALEILNVLLDAENAALLESCLGEAHAGLRREITEVLAAHGRPQWKSAVQGVFEDFASLARLGNQAAVERLLHLVQHDDEGMAKKAAGVLLQLAKDAPGVLLKHWQVLHQTLTQPHTDGHSDVDYNRSSDCTHTDTHSDAGFGYDFPEKPPRRSGTPRDF